MENFNGESFSVIQSLLNEEEQWSCVGDNLIPHPKIFIAGERCLYCYKKIGEDDATNKTKTGNLLE